MGRNLVLTVLIATLVGTPLSPGAAAEDATASSPNFRITYSTDPGDPDTPPLSDPDNDGVPDGIERVLAEFEAARSFLLGELGYEPPPNDGDYEIYVARGSGRAYTQVLPGPSERVRASFIVLTPDLTSLGLAEEDVARFAVHEYMHAVQNGYDALEDNWIKEATSAWVEDVYLDEADPNHFFVTALLKQPREALTSASNMHEYGAFLFLQFLTERYGGGSQEGVGLVRRLWELMAETRSDGSNVSSLEAIELILSEYGVTWTEAWREFILWNRRLIHYEEGLSYRSFVRKQGWPKPLRTTEVAAESCRLTTDDGSRLPALSAEYVRLRPGAQGSNATLTATGPAGSTGAYIVRLRGGGVQEGFLTFDDSGVAAAEVPFDPALVKNVLVALGNAAPASSPASIAYSLRAPDASLTSVSTFGSRSVIYGEAVRVLLSVTCGGSPAAFARVSIASSDAAGNGSEQVVTTSADGTASLLVSPESRTTFSARLVDPLLSPASSQEHVVAVQVRVSIDVSSQEVALNQPVRVSGIVQPAHPGAPLVVEFRRPERRWRTGATTLLNDDGSYDTSLTLPATGVWQVRSRLETTNDADHLPGDSVPRFVVVRSNG
jgi:hypothetical protein